MALTPKEAFEAVKKLWPDTVKLERAGNSWTALNQNKGIEACAISSYIDWASAKEYPLPEPKWRDARPEDVAYPFKEARFRDRDTHSWVDDTLSGYTGSGKWISQNGASWYMCQVHDEA